MTPKPSPSSPGPTWGELSSSIYRSHFSTQRSAKTSKSILDQADYWFTKDRNASRISRLTLREFVEFLRSQKDSEASIRRKVGVVMKVLREAYRDEKIPAVPMAPLLPPAAPGRLRWLSDTEEAELLRITSGDFSSLVIILIDTGLRLGEALALEWTDVGFVATTLQVGRSKNGTRRLVPMTSRVLDVFRRQRDAGFSTPFEGLNTWTVHRAWNSAREAMGLTDDPEFVPHCLRHTFASRLVQRGASLQSVQALLGHKRIEHTLIYAHLAPAQFRAAIDLLENNQ